MVQDEYRDLLERPKPAEVQRKCDELFRESDEYEAGEFQVNRHTTNSESNAAVEMNAMGDFVITWDSNGQDGSQDGIHAQRYQADVAPLRYQIEPTSWNAVASLSTPVTSSLLVFDQDSNNWTGATVQITINDRGDQDVLGFANTANITGSWTVRRTTRWQEIRW